MCVDALKDLRTSWCAWADHCLRGVNILASDWYGCGDISQLKNHRDNRTKETSHEAPTGSSDSNVQDVGVGQDDHLAASALGDYGEYNFPAFFEAHGQPLLFNDSQVQLPATPLSFLFSASEVGAEMNDMGRDWLADPVYDRLLTDFDLGDRGNSHI